MELGDTIPDVVVKDETGEIPLRSLVGGWAVIYFYHKDDTSGCTREALDFTELARDYEAAGIQVVGISKDSVASHGKFTTKHNLGVRLLSDEDGAACEAFGTWIEKSMYGRKYMGVDRTTLLIDREGTIARVWPKVKVPGHVEEVLAAARALA